jgi:hypothetical protein
MRLGSRCLRCLAYLSVQWRRLATAFIAAHEALSVTACEDKFGLVAFDRVNCFALTDHFSPITYHSPRKGG